MTAGESLLAISGLPLQAPDQSNKCQISAINIVEPAAHMMLAKAKPIKFGLLQVQILATGCSWTFANSNIGIKLQHCLLQEIAQM